ncbi:helix-turn-helix transcriptional regulator [Streptomyces olivoverticillatus]
MTIEQDALFARVDALLARPEDLPEPTERKRLREAARVTQQELADIFEVRRESVRAWEARPQRAEAAQASGVHPAAGGLGSEIPGTRRVRARARHVPPAEPEHPAPAPDAHQPAPTPTPPPPHEGNPKPSAGPPQHPPPPRPIAINPLYPHGPLAVLDGDGTAYCIGGVVLECPATTIPALVDWTLSESGLGAARLHRNGKDSDPLIVLTESAAERFGLPPKLDSFEGVRSQRLPDDHKVVKQLARAKWKLTQRGFGPWPRIYRPAQAGNRQCVQLAILPWGALDSRAWPGAATLPPAELARVLGVYASRVITPRGSTAVCGLELMSAMRPPTRAVKDEATGTYVSASSAGALTAAVDPAPPEAPPEHPVAQGRGVADFLDEEAYQWVRSPELLADAECLLPYAVGIDINTAFLAAAPRLMVGLGEPTHVTHPAFDKKIPGSWLVDLSHLELDPRLPSPFTPHGERPTGPAWYTTLTVAYAQELGARVEPVEAYLRYESGAYLDPWHERLKEAYVATLADLGVTKDLEDAAFLQAMEQHKNGRSGSRMRAVSDQVDGQGRHRQAQGAPAGQGVTATASGGPPWTGRPGGRTSGPRSSPRRGSTCTARWQSWPT